MNESEEFDLIKQNVKEALAIVKGYEIEMVSEMLDQLKTKHKIPINDILEAMTGAVYEWSK